MMAVNIANAIAEQGVESYLCTTRLEGELKPKIATTVNYLFLNKKKIIDYKAIKKLSNFIKNQQITVIHAHSSSYFIAFLIKILLPKIELVWHDHYGKSENLSMRKRFPLSLISRSFSCVISVNIKLLDWSKNYLNAKRYIYLPNFATLNKDKKKITYLNGKMGNRIVCLANLRPQKDHLNLLKAFKEIQKASLDWTLHLVGLDLRDVYSSEIKSYIQSNNLRNHVFLYGSCLDTQFILEQATIGVLSSKSEGLPVALLEYGLAKLPVVVTNVGECATVLQHGKNGLIVPPENDKKLAEALKKLCSDKELQDQFSVNLNNTVNQLYSKENFINQLLKIYRH